MSRPSASSGRPEPVEGRARGLALLVVLYLVIVYLIPTPATITPQGWRQTAIFICVIAGMVTDPLDLELVLDNESHSRARSMAQAINNRFPEQPGEGETARGRTARIIHITVPAAFNRSAKIDVSPPVFLIAV